MTNNTYHAEYQRNRYSENYKRATEYLGGKCAICGSRENLQFDHRDRTSKRIEVSSMFSKYSWDKILQELNKCQLLCQSCHTKKSSGEMSGRSPWNKGSGKLHGSYYGVYTLKCKCASCSEYRNRRLAKRNA